MKQIIFVGWIDKGNVPVVGETVKNQNIIAELKKYCKVISVDFYRKSKRPLSYIQAISSFLGYPHASIVLSTSAGNVYTMLKILRFCGIKRHIIHWVVGGAFPKYVNEGRFNPAVFNYVDVNLVQCQDMIGQLHDAGVVNVKYVSNFKKIYYLPNIENAIMSRLHESKIKFVFLGRMHPAKGCDYIVQATMLLNQRGYASRFFVDFWGKFDETYKDTFLKSIESIHNLSYKGQLNLQENQGYDILATYDAMLFPTYHPSEGFAGIFIDSFIAGLPVLASNWAYNSQIVRNGENGMIYPVHNVEALVKTMEECIIGNVDLIRLSRNARAEAMKYDASNVINEKFCKEIHLM